MKPIIANKLSKAIKLLPQVDSYQHDVFRSYVRTYQSSGKFTYMVFLFKKTVNQPAYTPQKVWALFDIYEVNLNERGNA